jgi:hypothetical protein
VGGDDEPFWFAEDREADVGREARAEPERLQFIRAGRFVMETRLDHVREKPRNRRDLDQLDLVNDELDQSLDVDSVLRRSSFSLLI